MDKRQIEKMMEESETALLRQIQAIRDQIKTLKSIPKKESWMNDRIKYLQSELLSLENYFGVNNE